MITQPALQFEAPVTHGRVRVTDPEGSHRAARKDRSQTVGRVLALFRPGVSLAAGECAALLPDAYSQTVRGIVSRLAQASEIVEDGPVRPSVPRQCDQQPYRLAGPRNIPEQGPDLCSVDLWPVL